MGAEAVFISYSHDSAEHSARVLELANALIGISLNVELDQFETHPRQGWLLWCEERLRPENAEYVLVICTPVYRSRVENGVQFDEGRGAFWEGALIHQYIYEEKGNTRFIPVLLGDAPDDSVPFPLRPYTRYRLKAFDASDSAFETLYRALTGQPAIVKPPPGPRVQMPPRTPSPPIGAESPPPANVTAPPPPDISRIDRYAPAELIGREAEMTLINDAWAKAVAGEAHPRVLTFVALGGEGKTALVAKWAVGMAEKDWPDCSAAFAWSFYSQGTREQVAASSDLFLAEALKFFGAPAVEGVESGHDKGRRLAKWIGDKRAALILDGLEPLQYAPTSPTAGELKDEGLRALLKGLVQHNRGLCLVTTRYAVKDLESYGTSAPQKNLAPLSRQAGAWLLEIHGVRGTRLEREQLSEDVKGHALTLNVIGAYLRDAYGGDIRRRDLVRLEEADEEEHRAFKAMDAYVGWFESDGERGARALAMLRLMGLFDRPADAACLEALWRAPAIEALTEPLVALSEAQRNIVLTRLTDAKLVSVNRDASRALTSLDAHPLLREYFSKHLRETRPDAWKAAHRRLYEHLTTTTQDKPEPTLDDLQPLYEAVAHGCCAGMHGEARAKVYRDRILRGTGWGGYYSTKKLGAIGADLGAVACFFDQPWRRVSPNLTPPVQAWLLGEAGVCLRALGRLSEAERPMRTSLDMDVERHEWVGATISASNLSELGLALGEVSAAIRDGEKAVTYADNSDNKFVRYQKRTTYADALHQGGRFPEAEVLFIEAEAIQAGLEPEYPLLYSLWGFQYCNLLLGEAERAVWRRLVNSSDAFATSKPLYDCSAVSERAERSLNWAKSAPEGSLLDLGLDHLTLGRAALYQAILGSDSPAGKHVKEAVDFLHRASDQAHFPGGLLTRALYRAATGDFDGAREDLDEALEIAERGPMRLHLADIHLHRARLFGLIANRPATYPWVSPRDDLDKARKLIDECGYGRRREELEDAEAAWRRLYSTSAPHATT